MLVEFSKDWAHENMAPAVAYFKLIEVMRDTLRTLYPGKPVSIEVDDDNVPQAVVVYGIGEHGLVRFALDYENHDLA